MADDRTFNPQAGAYADALLKQTALANATIHLFQADPTFNPNPGTELVEYTARECDFDSYAAKTAATWPNLFAAGGTQWLLSTDLLVWVWHNTGPGKGNDVGGMYIVDAGGVLRGVVVFGTPVGMGSEFAALPRVASVLVTNGT